MIDPKRIIFVPISALRKQNVIISMEEFSESFCEALIRCVRLNSELESLGND